MSKQLIFKIIFIIWLVVTFLSGLLEWSLVTEKNTIFYIHSYWSIITILPILGLILYRMHFISHSDSKDKKEYFRRQVALLLGVFVALLTGLGVQMGFLPLLFHQIIIWPLAFLFFWA